MGTPAITSRGFIEKDMKGIVELIDTVLQACSDHIGLVSGKNLDGTPYVASEKEQAEYDAIINSVRKKVNMKTAGMPLNRY